MDNYKQSFIRTSCLCSCLEAPAVSLVLRLLLEAHLHCESHCLSFFLVENDWRWLTILCLGQRSSLVYCCENVIFFSEFCIFRESKAAPILCCHYELSEGKVSNLYPISCWLKRLSIYSSSISTTY